MRVRDRRTRGRAEGSRRLAAAPSRHRARRGARRGAAPRRRPAGRRPRTRRPAAVHPRRGTRPMSQRPTSFQLRNVPLLSRVGADRADTLRTDIDAAVAGWSDALVLRVDSRNQVLISDGRVVLGKAAALGSKPTEHAVFLGTAEGRHSTSGRCAARWWRRRIPSARPKSSTCAGRAHLRRRQRTAGGHRDRAAELARQRAVQRRRRIARPSRSRPAGRGSTRSTATRSSRASTPR